jgi:hypothetical protein
MREQGGLYLHEKGGWDLSFQGIYYSTFTARDINTSKTSCLNTSFGTYPLLLL